MLGILRHAHRTPDDIHPFYKKVIDDFAGKFYWKDKIYLKTGEDQ